MTYVTALGCADVRDRDDLPAAALHVAGLIQFPVMHSAYDGVHDYRVVPWLPLASDDSAELDPIVAASVAWQVDDAYVSAKPYLPLSAALELTTRRAGETTVRVTATRVSGQMVQSEAALKITAVSAAEWSLGDERYHQRIAFATTLLRPSAAPSSASACGLPPEESAKLFTLQPCAACHDAANGVSVEYTPLQTAVYSDDELLKIITSGEKPFAGRYLSAFLNSARDPDCVFQGLHTWEIEEAVKRGLIWKLRSLAPQPWPDIDAARRAAGD